MMGISYDKKLRASAASQGKDLFACGFAQAKGKGLSEFMGPLEREMGEALFYFCHKVKTGETPADAFASTHWPDPSENKGGVDG